MVHVGLVLLVAPPFRQFLEVLRHAPGVVRCRSAKAQRMGGRIRPNHDQLAAACALCIPLRTNGECQGFQAVFRLVTAAEGFDRLHGITEHLGFPGQFKEIGIQHCVLPICQIIPECNNLNPQRADFLVIGAHCGGNIIIKMQCIVLYDVNDVVHASGCVNAKNDIYVISQFEIAGHFGFLRSKYSCCIGLDADFFVCIRIALTPFVI